MCFGDTADLVSPTVWGVFEGPLYQGRTEAIPNFHHRFQEQMHSRTLFCKPTVASEGMAILNSNLGR